MAGQNKELKRGRKLLLVSLLVILLSSLIASLVQSSFGRVQVYDIKVPAHNGQWLVADLYKPRSATRDNPAPLVVVIPGFQRSKEALANVAIELSRRGIVAVLIDPYAQGFSSASMSRIAATTEGYGMFAVVDYAAGTPNLNYVDKSR
ncbi:MAG: alpha/beta hydrolase, partial [Gammaproteobacteria bacterium]|nr:alpha/beta hydrolase [Gammaproteobacteria bacterium]